MYSFNNINFFFKTGMFIGNIKTMDIEFNRYNAIFFLGRKKSFFIINYKKFIYNIRICLFFLYRLIFLRGKILAYDDRFYIRRCLIFFFKRANQNYVFKHWIGGTLTNFKKFRIFFFQIIKGFISIKKYYDLFLYYYGLKTMQQMPAAVIFTNPNNDSVAFQETFRLGIPIISIVDALTKNTFGVTFPIPSNTTKKKTLIIFYSIIGDSLLYGFLKPVSLFFNLFFKRLKNIRKNNFIHQFIFQKVYTHTLNFFYKHIKQILKYSTFFFKNKCFFYFQKKKNFTLKFFFKLTKKKFLKNFFKISFLVLWSLKKLFKIKRRKKKRRKIFKKIFKYKKKYRRYKFLKIFKFLKKKVHKIIKKAYFFSFNKFFKKYKRLNYFIIYNKYRNQYLKKQINLIFKQAQKEQEDIEEILDEFDDLPEDRKNKKLKKMNESFKILKVVYLKKDSNKLNKFLKIKFIQKYNLLEIIKFKLKNKFLFNFKKLNIINEKKIFEQEFKFFFIKFKNNKEFLNFSTLEFFKKHRNVYLNLLKKRRENINLVNINNIKNNNISKINILYSKFEND